ncbi:MAG: transporter [Cyclobacteriaceae bacterium]|nr:transporter [Cyclobacteriaceae bacterium]
MKKYLCLICILPVFAGNAQTISDGLMMPAKNLCTGVLYTHDRWTNYWEGTLKRDNGNIGTLTTQSAMWVAAYGITKRLNALAALPYVWTHASQGTLAGQQGIQDLTLALKFNLLNSKAEHHEFKAFVVGGFSTPLSNYTPDFLPLSIGTGTTNFSGRITLNYAFLKNFYINFSGAYTWRSNIEIDRQAYYTNGQLYLTHEVWMPNVFDYFGSLGFHKGPLQTELNYSQQVTLGGDDIRRHDMPFPSNRMNFSKAGLLVMYYLPWPKYLAVRCAAHYTVSGRNVGQSTAITTGLLYTIIFKDKQSQL